MKGIFNLKSYFTFLSRNKIYSAINVFGLVVSLMFVILIGLYVWQEGSINSQNSKADRIELACMEYVDEGEQIIGCHRIVQRQLKKMFPDVESSCAITSLEIKVTKDNEFVRANALLADSTFFKIFDYKLLEGDPNTCLLTRDGVVVTENFARKMFGDKPAIGRNIVWRDSLNLKVTGVMQNLDHTIFANNPELIMNSYNRCYGNFANTEEGFECGIINQSGAAVFLLMKPGKSFAARSGEIDKALKDGPWSFLNSSGTVNFFFIPLNKVYTSGMETCLVLQVGNPAMMKILGAVAVVILLFSVMNYINLTVALSGRRAREMAARQLFGSHRRGIVMRLIMESLVLCVAAFVLALVLAFAFAPSFGKIIGTDLELSLLYSPVVIVVMVVFVVLLGVVAGTIPAVITSRVKPVEIFRGTFVHHTKMRLSRAFIVVQNVITIAMLSCSMVMLLQMSHLVNAPMGFKTGNILNIYADISDAFKAQLQQLPCVECVTGSRGLPMDGGNNNTVVDKGLGHAVSFQFFVVEKEFFDVYGLRLANGQAPESGHYYLNQQAISEVRNNPNVFGDEKTLCKRQVFSGIPAKTAQYGGRFVDFHIRNIQEVPHPMIIYVADKVAYPWQLSIKLKGNLADGYRQVADTYKEVFHEELRSDDAMFADQFVQKVFEKQTRSARVVGLFAAIAIVISLLGLVAMSTYFIQQRSKEIAIRKVFGSTSNQVRHRLIRSFLLYVVVAFVVAVPLFWYFMGKWMDDFSYRIVWWPWILVAGVAVLLISYVAVAIQSYLAANENPVLHVKDNE